MKKSVISILACILMVGVFFLGVHIGSAEKSMTLETQPTEIPAIEDTSAQNLRLSFAHNYNSHGYIPLEQGNYDGVGYSAIEDISIELGGESIPLEDALTEGKTSVDEIISWARKDVAQGFCTEVAKSKNGLTALFYHYGNSNGNFSLRYTYDVFESPVNGQHLITNFDIYSNGGSDYSFLPIDEETGKRLDYENWGLTFEVLEANSSRITVKCTQSGGQQIGSFTVEDVWAIKNTGPDFEALDWLTEEPASIAGTPLTMEGETELVVDFTELYGQLEAGEYVLSLDIQDQYNEEDVHPLMRNYHDRQVYQFPFTVE